ncbi:5-formyltetrahydrofolate cyclo-ligase [Sphingobacterium sp. lm-10]|uniref:5-formyltetrahydrofolate cyclo-ligase n=1 Tax=Sphingobacterium sp. lm-10 TaxID=2944904 RepID=UPI0020228D80|nr:5-formyltetrahydrofolate cyclo-ligase [Sphingobacterium sp. lm-10]MCL7988316.1 5-formyltetrahydrofolate cyclo-ligase [Sphingobacterium sp. lm-10]
MTKDTLRTIYKAKRMALMPEEKQLLDDEILNGLKSLDLSSVSYLHVYLPIVKWNEYDTYPFIYWLRQHHPAVHIVVSISEFEKGTLQHYVWNKESVVANVWGIPEIIVQPDTVHVDPQAIDLILIPLLVCDRDGNRIGYGKGFYDRFLQGCKTDVQKVGISYFDPMEEQIPADRWDVPLDSLITPTGSIRF